LGCIGLHCPIPEPWTDTPQRKDMSEPLPAMIETPKGLYRHYKGGQYRVLGTVRHSEDLQPMTLYQALYGEQGLWVRPAAMFADVAEFNGKVQPRFERIGD
jgi:hypothetical protein